LTELTVRGVHGVSPEDEDEGYGGKDLLKRKVLSLECKSEEVMDDKSGESIEKEVAVTGTGELELWRLV